MKTTIKTDQGNKGNGFLPPIIPLEKEEARAVRPADMLKMKLKSIPDSDTSPTYDLNVPFFSQGTPEEWIMFVKNLERVFLGQNLAEIEHKFALTHCLLTGAALTTFDEHFAGIENAVMSNDTF